MYTLEQIYEALGKIENGGTMVAYLQDAIRGARDGAAKNRIEKNKILDQLNLRQSGDTDGALKNLVATLTALQNAGDALSTLDTQMNGLKFQSTLLMRGATTRWNHPISPPRFQSTLLMRGATIRRSRRGRRAGTFQSTLLMRGATASRRAPVRASKEISIHAPHARSDFFLCCFSAPAI